MKSIPTLFFSVFLIACITPVFSQTGEQACGSLNTAFGPFDYRTERGDNLKIVESAHFTPSVESLIKSNAGYLGGDLSYTLVVFPNHHRALMSMMRYGEKLKTNNPPNTRFSVECYFDRAIRWRPDDAITRIIYAMFLTKNNRSPEALQQLDIAAAGAEGQENPFTHYNLGLNYFDMKAYDKALAQAQIAYSMGFPQPILKEKLKEVGKWVEPKIPAPETVTSSPNPLP